MKGYIEVAMRYLVVNPDGVDGDTTMWFDSFEDAHMYAMNLDRYRIELVRVRCEVLESQLLDESEGMRT